MFSLSAHRLFTCTSHTKEGCTELCRELLYSNLTASERDERCCMVIVCLSLQSGSLAIIDRKKHIFKLAQVGLFNDTISFSKVPSKCASVKWIAWNIF